MVEENGKPPQPPKDIMVTKTEAVVQVVHVLMHGGYDPDFLGPPNPIDQLVAALCVMLGSIPTPNAGNNMD